MSIVYHRISLNNALKQFKGNYVNLLCDVLRQHDVEWVIYFALGFMCLSAGMWLLANVCCILGHLLSMWLSLKEIGRGNRTREMCVASI